MGKEIVLVFFILIALVWIFTHIAQNAQIAQNTQDISHFTTLPVQRDRKKGKIMFNDEVKQRVYDKKTGIVSPEMIITINDLEIK